MQIDGVHRYGVVLLMGGMRSRRAEMDRCWAKIHEQRSSQEMLVGRIEGLAADGGLQGENKTRKIAVACPS